MITLSAPQSHLGSFTKHRCPHSTPRFWFSWSGLAPGMSLMLRFGWKQCEKKVNKHVWEHVSYLSGFERIPDNTHSCYLKLGFPGTRMLSESWKGNNWLCSLLAVWAWISYLISGLNFFIYRMVIIRINEIIHKERFSSVPSTQQVLSTCNLIALLGEGNETIYVPFKHLLGQVFVPQKNSNNYTMYLIGQGMKSSHLIKKPLSQLHSGCRRTSHSGWHLACHSKEHGWCNNGLSN